MNHRNAPDRPGRRLRVRALLLTLLVGACGAALAAASQTHASGDARSIILMIGDGMGVGQIEAARWELVGPAGLLTMELLNVQDGWSVTHKAGGRLTDSAAAATAMATGQKTWNGRLSVDPAGAILPTILERAQAAGKSVGLVTTVQLAHATPAAFAVHIANRGLSMPISVQLAEAGVDVLLGGGAASFLPRGSSCECGGAGQRTDNRELAAEASVAGWAFVCDAEGLAALDVAAVDRVLGLFAEAEMLRPLAPTLAEMIDVAIEILSRDPDGFFLMVEGGLIDWVCHGNDAEASIELTIGFDRAVGVALEYTRSVEGTLLIVTGDHETGGMSVTAEPTGYFREDGPFDTPDGETYYVNWRHGNHTNADVPVRAEGPLAELLRGTYENTRIYEVMLEAFGFVVSENETTTGESG